MLVPENKVNLGKKNGVTVCYRKCQLREKNVFGEFSNK